MEQKNAIIRGHCEALSIMTADVSGTAASLGDDAEINRALIATAYVQVEAIRAQLVLLTQALDNYGG